jgi:hypothetical protein
VNNKYSTYFGALAPTTNGSPTKGYGAVCDSSEHTDGCIAPYTGTADFLGTSTGTTGVLYGPRQVQFVAKVLF